DRDILLAHLRIGVGEAPDARCQGFVHYAAAVGGTASSIGAADHEPQDALDFLRHVWAAGALLQFGQAAACFRDLAHSPPSISACPVSTCASGARIARKSGVLRVPQNSRSHHASN